jgi:hypothetical protein
MAANSGGVSASAGVGTNAASSLQPCEKRMGKEKGSTHEEWSLNDRAEAKSKVVAVAPGRRVGEPPGGPLPREEGSGRSGCRLTKTEGGGFGGVSRHSEYADLRYVQQCGG